MGQTNEETQIKRGTHNQNEEEAEDEEDEEGNGDGWSWKPQLIISQVVGATTRTHETTQGAHDTR